MTAEEKALEATQGTQFGAILRCAYGKNVGAEFPRFLGKCSITSDGLVMADFVDSRNRHHMGGFVGSVEDLANNVSGLAAHLKLDKAEAAALAKVVVGWIGTDFRSPPRKELLQ